MTTNNQNLVEVSAKAMQAYLISIGFHLIADSGHSLAFRHDGSGVVVALANSDNSDLVRPADFLSIRVRLESEQLITEDAAEVFKQGRLPLAS